MSRTRHQFSPSVWAEMRERKEAAAAAARRERVRKAVEQKLIATIAIPLDEKGISLAWRDLANDLTDAALAALDNEPPA
jgi:hypothetical protein